jgi:phosphodiesterase/alkaline phosphatase D-like protein
MSVKAASTLAAFVLASSITSVALAADDHSDSAAVDNPDNCQVVERKPGDEKSSGNLSSSVTAGNGQVSAHSSGGHGVTVHSGNGNVSSSVATTGSGKGSTMVTTSNGDCIIYVNPGEKKED